jgi:hypothetical protein
VGDERPAGPDADEKYDANENFYIIEESWSFSFKAPN